MRFRHLLHLLVCTDTEKTPIPKEVHPQEYFKIAAAACSSSQARQMPNMNGMNLYASDE